MKIFGKNKLPNIFLLNSAACMYLDVVCKKLLGTLIWLMVAVCQPVFAAGAVQIGPGLQVLTQLQGAWSNGCRRAGLKPSEGYRKDFLSVNFTHLEFVAKIYSDEGCIRLLTQWPAKFRFGLGDAILLPNQDQVFELDLVEESDPAKAWSLSVNNILLYKSGRLFLGRESLLGQSASRLSTLDHDQFYSRR